MMFLRTLLAASLLALGLGHAPAALAQADGVLRVSAIPDEAPTELQRKFKPLGEYLAKATGLKVEFVPVTDYAAVVEGLLELLDDGIALVGGGSEGDEVVVVEVDAVGPELSEFADSLWRGDGGADGGAEGVGAGVADGPEAERELIGLLRRVRTTHSSVAILL